MSTTRTNDPIALTPDISAMARQSSGGSPPSSRRRTDMTSPRAAGSASTALAALRSGTRPGTRTVDRSHAVRDPAVHELLAPDCHCRTAALRRGTGTRRGDRGCGAPDTGAARHARCLATDLPPQCRHRRLYFTHGGGIILGDNRSLIGEMLDWVQQFEVVLVSVDYQLAPEHPYPAGIEDVYTGLVWTANHAADLGIDPDAEDAAEPLHAVTALEVGDTLKAVHQRLPGEILHRPAQEGPRPGGETRELGRGLAPPVRQDHAVRRVLTSSTWHRGRTSRTWKSTSPCPVATGRQLPEEAANCPSAASLRQSQRPTGPVRAGRRRRVPRRVRRVR
ncbi:alpha/beta hydrolase fold domain-containing protein [Streptomyces sp. NBC_00987]|uniref:alpha/beta hydrolase fold domain-containing protein n=1 Tax=Streptomyces sp. NBC_00987 TaxID=2903703 RepID=UPI003866ED35